MVFHVFVVAAVFGMHYISKCKAFVEHMVQNSRCLAQIFAMLFRSGPSFSASHGATHALCEECLCPVPRCVSWLRCCNGSWNPLCLAIVSEALVCADALGVGMFSAMSWVCIDLGF